MLFICILSICYLHRRHSGNIRRINRRLGVQLTNQVYSEKINKDAEGGRNEVECQLKKLEWFSMEKRASELTFMPGLPWAVGFDLLKPLQRAGLDSGGSKVDIVQCKQQRWRLQ